MRARLSRPALVRRFVQGLSDPTRVSAEGARLHSRGRGHGSGGHGGGRECDCGGDRGGGGGGGSWLLINLCRPTIFDESSVVNDNGSRIVEAVGGEEEEEMEYEKN